MDIHKEYFVAVAVNQERETVFGPKGFRIINWRLGKASAHVPDAIVLEMTTNTYLFHDTLLPLVHSVIAVHPPNVPLVTNVHVKTTRKQPRRWRNCMQLGCSKGCGSAA